MARKPTQPIRRKELARLVDETVMKAAEKALTQAQAKPKQLSANEQKLKDIGLHAYYKHYRFKDGSAISMCTVENNENTIIARGYAICSHRDNFCRADGRVKSLGRAIGALVGRSNQYPMINHRKPKNQALEALLLTDKFMARYFNPEIKRS